MIPNDRDTDQTQKFLNFDHWTHRNLENCCRSRHESNAEQLQPTYDENYKGK